MSDFHENETLIEGIEFVRLGGAALDAAEKRASEVGERAFLNEAIKIISELEHEVRTMHIANRFSRIKKPSESGYAPKPLNLLWKDLTEDEYKRKQLLVDLEHLKQQILSATTGLKMVVMDIEATKTDDISNQSEVK